MAKKLPRGLTQSDGRYRVQITSRHTQPGKRYRERLPEGTTKRQAEAYLANVQEQDRLGELLWPSEKKAAPQLEPETPSVGTYADETYLPWCRARNTSSTIKYKIDKLAACADWFWDVPLDEITPSLVYTYQAERKEQGVRGKTVNLEWSVVRHLLNHAYKTGAVPYPPPEIERIPTTDARPSRALDIEEATRALEYAAGRSAMWYALAMTLLHTGARWGDVRGLRWEDVDLDEGVVSYRAETAKQSRDREVPLVPELVEALRALPQEHELVFVRRHRVTGEWIELGERSHNLVRGHPWGGPDGDCQFGSHTWRHTFATWKLRAGVSVVLVSRWLGHASISITVDRYGHIEPADHKEEIMRGPRPQVARLRVVGEE